MGPRPNHREGELEAPRLSFWRRHRWLAWMLAAAGAAIVAVSIALAVAARQVQPYLRARIVAGLEERFHTRVELDHFRVSVHHGEEAQWGLWATGRGLRIWPPHRTGGDHPLETAVESMPLIQLSEFSFHLPILLKRIEEDKPLRIAEVRLTGLTVRIPPRSERDKVTGLNSALKPQPGNASSQQPGGLLSRVQVDRVVCDETELVLETEKPGKLPLDFDLIHLKLTHLRAGEPMDFDADLVNPRPSGPIHTTGSFGPWNVDDPGASPVTGKYRFERANLAEFKGIGGMLSSDGAYQGILRNIAIDGEANVPDFSLSQFGTAMPLHTNFRAHVDGTDGDTYLDEVDALLGRSRFKTAGKVVRVKPGEAATETNSGSRRPDTGGHVIDLKIDVPQGQIDDFLRLVSKSNTPLMTGTVGAHAVLHIPPGDKPVYQRLNLDGTFDVEDARFTSEKVQGHIEDLSLRGQGRPDDLKHTDPESIVSRMQGSFHMADGAITLPDLRYSVPGADIELKGTYALQGALNFDGTARMQATISQMVGGWKGVLLRPADRFFKKDGAGTLVPIKIRGSRQEPEFTVDFAHLSHTTPERPGEKQP